MRESQTVNKILYKKLTYREMEYLDYFDHHDKTMYGELVELLTQELEEHNGDNKDGSHFPNSSV